MEESASRIHSHQPRLLSGILAAGLLVGDGRVADRRSPVYYLNQATCRVAPWQDAVTHVHEFESGESLTAGWRGACTGDGVHSFAGAAAPAGQCPRQPKPPSGRATIEVPVRSHDPTRFWRCCSWQASQRPGTRVTDTRGLDHGQQNRRPPGGGVPSPVPPSSRQCGDAPRSLMRELRDRGGPTAEGYLFPDTYYFPRGLRGGSGGPAHGRQRSSDAWRRFDPGAAELTRRSCTTR